MKSILGCCLPVFVLLIFASDPACAQSTGNVTAETIVLEDTISISFTLSVEPSEIPLSTVILRINEGNSHFLSLLMNFESGSPVSLLLMGNESVYKTELPPDLTENRQLNFSVMLTTSDDRFILRVAEYVATYNKLGLSGGSKYNILVLPDYSTNYDSSGNKIVDVSEVVISTGKSDDSETGSTEILLLLLLVVADIALFIVIHYRNRYKKNRRGRPRHGQISISNEELAKPELNWTSTVKLFGRFRVYTAEGEEISGSFSPTLRELFLLLLCYQPETGISSSKLKEILWFDKSEESARNNRSVYITKLRQLLDKLGEHEISSSSGNWKADMKDISVDYFNFNRITESPTISENDIHELISIIREGNLLTEYNYSWLDETKARTADRSITILTSYARHLKMEQKPGLISSVADALFVVDPVSELALSYKCKYYNHVGKGYLAKQLYSTFIKDYKNLYGEDYRKTYSDILIEEAPY